MAFNSLNFIVLFLPIFLLIYILTDTRYKNYVILIASCIFFSWGQLFYLPLMIVIIIFNFYLAKSIENKRDNAVDVARGYLILGCVTNCVLLVFFKAFFVFGNNWNFLPPIIIDQFKQNSLPLGLSYITFQVVSYIVDVYNERCDSEKSLLNFSLYIMLFPKILAGPITYYRGLIENIKRREIEAQKVANGLRRFIVGLAKKVLVADTLARTINPAFSMSTPNYSTSIAWFVIIAYAIQLYFDFSGLTDMAIGLGQIMGFKFVENFNYPYISRSITEFWRRWHISLSSWFRDYVFYPLEFSRRSSTFFRQQINIIIVFFLTGLWHGLTLNFLIWGALHGAALALEMSFSKKLKLIWRPLQHFYTIVIVLAGWVFFRSPSISYSIALFARLLGFENDVSILPFFVTQPLPIIDNSVWISLVVGIVFSVPIFPGLRTKWEQITHASIKVQVVGQVICDIVIVGLGLLSIAAITSFGVSSSIYGGF
jgi:alginate O-acetyltransferase complex protein AlgI